MRTSACSPSLDGRETRAFYFIVCVLLAVSASSGNTTTQELCGRKQRIQRQIRTNILRNSTKNRQKIDEKPSQIDEKSTKNRSWAVLGAQSRFRDAPGRVRDGPGTRQSRPGVDLGTPRARQERPGVAQKRARDGAETLPSCPGALPERVQRIKQGRTRWRNDFSTFLLHRASALMRENVAPAIVLYTRHEVSNARAQASKKLENRGVSASPNDPGSVRASPNRTQAAWFERQNRKKSREAHRFFFK